MALGAFKQFLLLSWKNWMLQKRKVWTTVFELGLPLLFSAILLIIRNFVPFDNYVDPTTYEPFVIDRLPNTLIPPNISGFPPYYWKMAYAPNVTIVNDIMEKVTENLQRGAVVQLSDSIGFPTEEDLLDFFSVSDSSISKVLGGVVFHNDFGKSMPSDPTYSIRLSANPRNAPVTFQEDGTWLTEELFPFYQFPGPRELNYSDGGQPGYSREGFLALQHAIDKAIMELQGVNMENHTSILQRYPYPPYFYDTYILILQTSFPDLIMLSLVFVALNVAKSVTHERETKLKESMKMMGLSGWIHWAAWFVKSFIYLLITISIMTLFFSIKVGKSGAAVVNNSDKSIVFLFLLLYAVATICYSFAISTFFTKANSAAVAAGVLFFLTYMPYYFILFYYSDLTLAGKLSSALMHNTCMGLGGLLIGLYEGTGEGIQYHNINVPFSVDDNLTFLYILLMFGVDIVFYSLVCWYVEAVFPGEYGVPQPWYFPVSSSYWRGSPKVTEANDPENFMMDNKNRPNAEYFEPDPNGINVGIAIRNLKKVFHGHDGEKVAVNEISLNMYEGQITALLGHNGAGKTTTMSMLTGLFPATSGTAIVNGCNIKTNLNGVRSSLGLCPQHDVLFGELTVEEHLYFFAKLKGLESSSQVKSEIDHYLSAMGLEDKRNQYSKSLSGGMKRKLSCGIALIADSKVVMLDEPTSGMDPDARRFTWDLLQRHREGRTILLTTHHMDEADLLGDRIAIMTQGELQCCGSSLFLKKKYGVGYHMVIVKEPQCNVPNITELVQSFVPSAMMESNIGAELSYVLPSESSSNFEELFTSMETDKSTLGISSYGASVTTMEEVFIKVGEKSDDAIQARLQHIDHVDEGDEVRPGSNSGSSEDSHLTSNGGPANNYGALPPTTKVTPFETPDTTVSMDALGSTAHIIKSKLNSSDRNSDVVLYFQQFYAMMVKHALHSFRNVTVALVQLALPLVFVSIAIALVSLFPGSAPQPPLEMTTEIYGTSFAQYSCGANGSTEVTEELCEQYAAQFRNTPTETTNIDDETAVPHDMSDYLLHEADEALNKFIERNLISATFQDYGNSRIVATAWFNNQPYHCPPLALNALSNAYAKYYLGPKFKIKTINHPLPPNIQQQVASESENFGTGSLVAFEMITGLSFLASSFAVFLITENVSKAKHLQVVSGVQLSNFWLSTYLWDLINFMIPSLAICLLFWATGVDAFGTEGRVWITLLILFLTGWAVIPFTYLLSFLFHEPATGYIRVLLINLIGTFIFYFLYELLALEGLGLKSVADILNWIFLLVPLYPLGRAFEDFYTQYSLKLVCTSFPPYSIAYCEAAGIPWETDYLAWADGGIGKFLVFLAIEGFLYFGLVFLVDSQPFAQLKHHYARQRYKKSQDLVYSEAGRSTVEEDEDVAAERKRITTLPLSQLQQENLLVVKNLRKVYSLRGRRGNLLAVDDMCVGVPQGECFGLLGINGAGKTTTFKMLTGDVAVTSGSAYLKGYSIKSDIKKVQQLIGYCPQFDALIDQMTGRETLRMYGRLRGVPEEVIPSEVNRLLNALMLEPHADKFTKSYSGGNKRKLSTAIALMGDPPVVFLDEPTTGLDPVARRLMWDTLCKVRDSGKSIILTSHSMEECEALCTRIAIMVNGQFKCLGSQQHLKNRFGAGFTVLAKSKYGQNLQGFKSFMEQAFPGCKLKDEHQGMVHYHITDVSLSWAQIFGSLEKAKVTYDIEDYSVSQTTLEQVFLNLARAQREDSGEDQR